MTRIMPSRDIQLFDNCSFVQAPVVDKGTETMVLASAVSRLDVDKNAVVANGGVYLIPGAGCTGIIVRLREGFGVTGGIAYEPVGYGPPAGIGVTPGVVAFIPIAAVVNAGYQQTTDGGQYSVTIQQVGANGAEVTGNAEILNGSVAWFAATWWDQETTS